MPKAGLGGAFLILIQATTGTVAFSRSVHSVYTFELVENGARKYE